MKGAKKSGAAGNSAIDALLRSQLNAFVEKAHRELQGSPLVMNWHIDAICDRMERLYRAEFLRLIINLPPRHLKSHCVSVAFVAWLLGQNPQLSIIVASHNEKLATDLSYRTRKIMMSAWYKRLFPKTRLSPDDAGKTAFTTTAGGGRRATWVGDGITGHGADVIIVDDIMTPEGALNGKTREDTKAWLDGMLYTRLNNKKTGAIVHIQHRLHLDDITAHVLEQEEYEQLILPAIAEEDHVIPDVYGEDLFRPAGDILHPEREGEAEFRRQRRIMGEAAFQAQYQQQPIPSTGSSFQRKWMKLYDKPPEEPWFIIQSWDLAISVLGHADFSVCTTWAVVGRRYYLIDLVRGRFRFDQITQQALALQHRHNPDLIIIENAGLGTPLRQALRSRGIAHTEPFNPTHSKEIRAEQSMIAFTEGRVFFPRGKFLTKLAIDELMAFPEGRHDDIVDSITQFLHKPEYWKSAAKAQNRPARAHLQQTTESLIPEITVMRYRQNYWDRNGGSPPF